MLNLNAINKYIYHNLLICLAIISHVCPNEWEDKGIYPKKEHSLVKPYQGTGMTIPSWDFSGSTMVTTSFIRITPDQQSRMGGLWNKIPFDFRNWEIQIHFKVSGHGKDLFGDGMAFWYIRDPLKPGNIFGNSDFFVGLGIFLDTYANQNGIHSHGHPYISAMVNNGTNHYDHDRDGTHSEMAGCESKFRGSDHDTYLAIRYENDILTVNTMIDGTGDWKECFTVKGVRLPTGYYFGVTAATGDLSDNHDVISIKSYELEVPSVMNPLEDRSKIIPSASIFAPPRDHTPDPPPPMSGFKFFLVILCAIIGVIVCVVVGIMVFQKNQQNSRKRFY